MRTSLVNLNNPECDPRDRDDALMFEMARVALGAPIQTPENADTARLLGYAADLVRGTQADHEGRISALAASCRAAAKPACVAGRDPVQAYWGVDIALCARKLRLETPMAISTLEVQGFSRPTS